MRTFPKILNINDVLPHIKDRKEFIVAEKDGYTVINYVMMQNTTFPAFRSPANPHTSDGMQMWDAALQHVERTLNGASSVDIHNYVSAILRECRGLKFDTSTGDIIARPYHKFFNVGERNDTEIENINFKEPHKILQKLDGSMIHPIPLGPEGLIRWCTKMGITDTAMRAEVYIAKNPIYTQFANDYVSRGVTPIFEWLSPKDQIVEVQTEDKLVLTAIRDNHTGLYGNYDLIKKIGEHYNIPVVQQLEIRNSTNLHDVVKAVKEYGDSEGIVIRFDDGEMYKIKSDWYIQLHRAKDVVRDERGLVEAILDDRLDDLMAVLTSPQKKVVQEFSDKLNQRLDDLAAMLADRGHEMVVKYQNKKNFALAPESEHHMVGIHKTIMFRMFDDSPSWIEGLRGMQLGLRKSLTRVESYAQFKATHKLPTIQPLFDGANDENE